MSVPTILKAQLDRDKDIGQWLMSNYDKTMLSLLTNRGHKADYDLEILRVEDWSQQ